MKKTKKKKQKYRREKRSKLNVLHLLKAQFKLMFNQIVQIMVYLTPIKLFNQKHKQP